MGNLADYAKDELKRIGMIDSGEEYNDWASKAILDLIELFASQNHSGFTAPYVASMFHRLAMFKPVSPLTGEGDEWNELGDGSFQNKRYSAVFKKGKDGTAYNIEGKVFTDDGEVWYTCRDSRVNVTFPYAVPDKPEYVYRNNAETPKTGWIPVSEKLPKDGEWAIFTDGNLMSIERYKMDALDHFYPEGRYFDLEAVVAWMPLPEKYKAESEEAK